MSKDLIFHLGLTKTGSSFLQHKLFLGKYRTLDRSVGYEADVATARRFQDFFLNSSPRSWRSAEGKVWFDRLADLGDSSALISHESLWDHIPFTSSKERLHSEPDMLAQRLEAIAEYCWPHGDVKVFFFFRNQADWLASIYSHMAYTLPAPSQKAFELSVSHLLDANDGTNHVADYFNLTEVLSSRLGKSNILAVPYERFSSRETWEKISRFSNLPLTYELIPFSDTSINSKRTDVAGNWAPSGRITKLGQSTISRSLRRFLPEKLERRLSRWVKGSFTRSWQITMPDDVRHRIIAHYAQGNKSLSESCGVDLADLGYFPSEKNSSDEC